MAIESWGPTHDVASARLSSREVDTGDTSRSEAGSLNDNEYGEGVFLLHSFTFTGGSHSTMGLDIVSVLNWISLELS